MAENGKGPTRRRRRSVSRFPSAVFRQSLSVVCSRFNEKVTSRLLASCLGALEAGGIPPARVRVVRVPGSWEIPWAAQEEALSGRCRAVICLGAIIQGETPQNRYLSSAVFSALQEVGLKTRVPVFLGVITVDNVQQAMARTRGSLDRGREAAESALDMLAAAARPATRSRRGGGRRNG